MQELLANHRTEAIAFHPWVWREISYDGLKSPLALAALAALAVPRVLYESPLVGIWNYPEALPSVWALVVSRRPRPADVIDLTPIARRTLPRYKVRVLTEFEAGTQSYEGKQLVFDGGSADTLDLAVRPVWESKKGLLLCSVAVYRTVVRREPELYMKNPLLLYQTIGYAHGPKEAVREIERQLNELGECFEVGRTWAAERRAKLPPKRTPDVRP